jgi:hypothetical protein
MLAMNTIPSITTISSPYWSVLARTTGISERSSGARPRKEP